MIRSKVKLEKGRFGTKAILTAPWSSKIHKKIMDLKPDELELNTSKGWYGNKVDFLEDYDWLKSLTIIDMNIANIQPIHFLTKLESIKIVTYCNTKIDFSCFSFLQTCSLEWRPGAESVFDCKGLKDLFLNRYKGKTIVPFGGLINLERLGILNSPISELDKLSKLENMKYIRLGSLRHLISINGIESLLGLEELTIENCKLINSILPLSKLKNLTFLNISDCGSIDSLSPIRDLVKLETFLFYESSNIVDGDLAPAFNHPSISKISFQNRRHYFHKREEFGGRYSTLMSS